MTKLAPEWVRTSDPVIRSPARYRWTTAPACVSRENQYLFAYTGQSEDSITGYNEIRILCESLGISVITAAAMRHRSSTSFLERENIAQATVDGFMTNLGHSQEIDKNVYACPPAISS